MICILCEKKYIFDTQITYIDAEEIKILYIESVK